MMRVKGFAEIVEILFQPIMKPPVEMEIILFRRKE
jgi:hypothetical protein